MRVVEAGVVSPTSTEGLPPVIACACGALIWAMSHCRPESGSAPTGALPGNGVLAAPPASTCSFGNFVAKPAVADAFSTRLSCSKLSLNDALSERAIATPIWS
jgi:hypothetical protein